MKKLILIVILFSLSATTYSCAQSKSAQKEKLKATYNNSKALVNTQTFHFVGELVYNNKNREKLSSDAKISINESSVSGKVISLSHQKKSFYLGGDIENYKTVVDDETQQISIEFSVNKHKVFIDIKPNGNAFLTISSGADNTISWTGHIE
jgi:hypothetical protein